MASEQHVERRRVGKRGRRRAHLGGRATALRRDVASTAARWRDPARRCAASAASAYGDDGGASGEALLRGRFGEIEARNWARCAGSQLNLGRRGRLLYWNFAQPVQEDVQCASAPDARARQSRRRRGTAHSSAQGALGALGAVGAGLGARQACWATGARWRSRPRRGSWATLARAHERGEAGAVGRAGGNEKGEGGGWAGRDGPGRRGGLNSISPFLFFSFSFLFISV
jgi:hypothetical protein